MRCSPMQSTSICSNYAVYRTRNRYSSVLSESEIRRYYMLNLVLPLALSNTQAIWFMNGFWDTEKGGLCDNAEEIWRIMHHFAKLDSESPQPKGEAGNELDQFYAAKFLEENEETLTAVERKAVWYLWLYLLKSRYRVTMVGTITVFNFVVRAAVHRHWRRSMWTTTGKWRWLNTWLSNSRKVPAKFVDLIGGTINGLAGDNQPQNVPFSTMRNI